MLCDNSIFIKLFNFVYFELRHKVSILQIFDELGIIKSVKNYQLNRKGSIYA